MQAWQQLQQRYSALTLRERGLILLSGLVLFLFGGYTLLVEPQAQALERSQQQLSRSTADQDGLTRQLEELSQRLVADPNAKIQQEIERLQQQSQQLDLQLAEQTIDLIPPQKMAKVLETLLVQGNSLKLLSLTSLAPQPTLEVDEEDPQAEQFNLYRHGIVLSVKGRYFDILKFLNAVEELPWRFYWQRFDYSVEHYPRAVAEIELFSLSTSREFIGG